MLRDEEDIKERTIRQKETERKKVDDIREKTHNFWGEKWQ